MHTELEVGICTELVVSHRLKFYQTVLFRQRNVDIHQKHVIINVTDEDFPGSEKVHIKRLDNSRCL